VSQRESQSQKHLREEDWAGAFDSMYANSEFVSNDSDGSHLQREKNSEQRITS
jgi:hypothetical protein